MPTRTVQEKEIIRYLRQRLTSFEREKADLEIPARITYVDSIFDVLVNNKWFLNKYTVLRDVIHKKLTEFKQLWYYEERAKHYLSVLFGQ